MSLLHVHVYYLHAKVIASSLWHFSRFKSRAGMADSWVKTLYLLTAYGPGISMANSNVVRRPPVLGLQLSILKEPNLCSPHDIMLRISSQFQPELRCTMPHAVELCPPKDISPLQSHVSFVTLNPHFSIILPTDISYFRYNGFFRRLVLKRDL